MSFSLEERARRSARASARNFKHGHRGSPEYIVWQNIKARCLNPNHAAFKNYGGRGIAVWLPWVDDFACFLRDVGSRPSPLHSIDRIDNDDDYRPGNVRWATRSEQAKNRRARPRTSCGQFAAVEAARA